MDQEGRRNQEKLFFQREGISIMEAPSSSFGFLSPSTKKENKGFFKIKDELDMIVDEMAQEISTLSERQNLSNFEMLNFLREESQI